MENKKYLELLQEAKESWEQLSVFRKKRNRCRDYTYGRQWNDIIEVDGRRITEYEYILSEGNVPLKNNIIRRVVRNVLGVFRERLPEILKEEYGKMPELMKENSLEEIFSRSMEEFLISGLVVHRKRIDSEGGDPSVKTEIVSPGSFFFNTDSRDPRGWDINLVGQVHKVSFGEWCSAFVKTRDDFQTARQLFSKSGTRINVTEIWKKEPSGRYLVHDRDTGTLWRCSEDEAGAENMERQKKWVMGEVWRYYFLLDDGRVLQSGESPYLHGSHPYVMKGYPFIEGEINSLVGDMIDQQRYTNRLITLYDWTVRASAKGVLLVPEGAVEPENLQEMADQWGRFNGVILYKARPDNPEPRQVNGNAANAGISELLEIQLKMMEDVSGVNGILQGNTSGANVSGELYNQQTTNALYSLSDILKTFESFIRDSAAKDKMLVQQCETQIK